MKTFEIFGKKVPFIAVLMALLVIGTASAAVFMNYATLSGTVEVSNGISVTDSNGETFEANGEGVLNFSGPTTFVINNANNEPTIVNLVTVITLDEGSINDLTGLTVDYSVIDGTGVVEATGIGTPVLVPPGGLTVEVVFDAANNAMPGEYEVVVGIDYIAEEYESFTGENAMVDVILTHKDGEPHWNTTGDTSDLSYVPMGNEFYYELNAIGLNAEETYSLIYYADPWPATYGTSIDEFATDESGSVVSSGHADLNMDLPNSLDDNYGEGAKVWVVPTNHLTNGDLPMSTWNYAQYLYEYSEILEDEYTDLVNYEDTNA